MVFVGYWNFAIFRFWRQNKLDADSRYPAIKEEQQNISLSENKNVGGDECQPQEDDDTVENEQMGSQFLAAAAAAAQDSVSRDEQPRGQHNAAKQQFHIRLKKERAKERAFVRSLLVVFLLMVLCYIPYGIMVIIKLIDPSYEITTETIISTTVMALFNSSVNWIVYGVMNRSFRRRYVTLVRRVLGTCFRRPCSRPDRHV
nr:hypothetical protein BaRGS_034565 [Batillaria attramentaria]